jgi:CRP-like cAMP-binding protein
MEWRWSATKPSRLAIRNLVPGEGRRHSIWEMADVKSAKLFKDLPEAELKSIERQLKTVKHPAGHEIVVRGSQGVGFMIITEGKVTVSTVQGKSRKLGPGDSFGEMALLDQDGRSANVKADTDVTLATIPEWNFKSFLQEHPTVAYRLLQVLSQRVRQAEGDD